MKIRRTQDITLDDKKYEKEDYWANIDYSNYVGTPLIDELELEEVTEDRTTFKRIKHTLENAYKVELFDLRRKQIDISDLYIADESNEYKLVDDSKDETTSTTADGTKVIPYERVRSEVLGD